MEIVATCVDSKHNVKIVAISVDVKHRAKIVAISVDVKHCAEIMAISVAYLSTHTVYQYKIQLFFHYFGRIWSYWKMDPGKHNFLEILLLF